MARFSPRSQRRAIRRRCRRKRLRSVFGVVELQLCYGQDPGDGHWGHPLLESWGVGAHQQLTPAAREKLCFTATATGTFEEAAAVAAKWGLAVEDSTIHQLVQQAGARAERQLAGRLAQAPPPAEPGRAPSALANLMVDGCQIRFRGAGWGAGEGAEGRVEWHELKLGVFYLEEQRATSAGGRGCLSDKRVVAWQGEADELGRRLHWEARRWGLAGARRVRCVNDGAPWIWKLVKDRWSGAEEVLDFYHASEHLGELARAMWGDTPAAGHWAEQRRHELRHGQEVQVLDKIRQLKAPRGPRGKIVRRERRYFAGHAHRMRYQSLAESGPIGSGAVESACRQRQCRFKRPGQFWTPTGLRHLGSLDEARRNDHWEQLWFPL